MKKQTLFTLLTLCSTMLLLTGCQQDTTKTTSKVEQSIQSVSNKVEHLQSANKTKEAALDRQESSLSQQKSAFKTTINSETAVVQNTPETKDSMNTDADAQPNLATLEYSGQQEITVNQNDPGFTDADQDTTNGAWTAFSDLDQSNRVGMANAMLSQSIMPTEKRGPLTWNPTGWHNKRTAHGWLYNRSHLIGFQLSGENNNPKNLMTGTMSLNNPLMLAHEMDIAHFLKQHPDQYVRYQVKPIFRGQELLARGVQLRAQSVHSQSVHFNVYIFNIESGYILNYADGTSQSS